MANVLEGSVRKQDKQVRIVARLVQVADGRELWSHEYDGDLSDVFKLQQDIATAITDQLRVVLVGGQKDHLVPELTANPDAHALYLRASETFARRDGAHFPDAIAQLQQAIALDPKFARAHARLAAVHVVSSNYVPVDLDESLKQAEAEAQAALALDSQLAEAHAVLGAAAQARRHYVDAHVEFDKAIAIDPRDTLAIGWLGLLWSTTGDVPKATQCYDRILAIDPLLPSAIAWRASSYFRDGDNVDARRLFEQSVALGLSWSEARFADLEYAEGHKDVAVARATRGLQAHLAEFPQGTAAILAKGIYGDDTAARTKAIAAVEAYLATKPKSVAGAAPWALMRLGEPARALEVSARGPTGNDTLMYRDIWSFLGKDVRVLPQFGDYLRTVGIAAFWDRYGPAPGCHRNRDGRYACE